jgi:hypothetical protein
MSPWRVGWAVCLLLHRFDTEGLGVFTASNPLDAAAADEFMHNEPEFIARCN